jgi:hypothetical protein
MSNVPRFELEYVSKSLDAAQPVRDSSSSLAPGESIRFAGRT